MLYRPVEAAGQKYDPMELTHFVFRLIGQQMPQDSRILNVLSRQLLYGGSFSFAELEPKLKEKPVMEKLPEPVQEETPRYEERHPIQAKPYVPPKPVMEPPKTEIPKQEPVVPEPAQDNPFAQSGNPFAEVQPKNEKPQKENKKAEKKPEKKSGGLFGLFGGKKDKKKAGSEEQENPFQQKEEPPQAAQKGRDASCAAPAPGRCAHAGSGCPESRSRPDGAAVWQRERRDRQNDGHGERHDRRRRAVPCPEGYESVHPCDPYEFPYRTCGKYRGLYSADKKPLSGK